MTGIVVDLSVHPIVSYAVVRNGQLLPVRFATELQAQMHLAELKADGLQHPRHRRPERASA